MKQPGNFPPDPNALPLAPGETRKSGVAWSWTSVAPLAIAALASALAWSPEFEGTREEIRAMFVARQPEAPPPAARQRAEAPIAKAPATKPTATEPAATAPFDDRARPVSFYFGRWGVNEAQSPVGWTSRIEIHAAAGGRTVAKVWITCPQGHCEAGEIGVTPVTHLQKKDMTAFLSMQRPDGDRTWTLLLRPAPGRPDELERWEWYGPPGTETRTHSSLGHVRRMRTDGTYY